MTRTPDEALRLLGILKQTFLVLGIVYVALHAWVSLTAYLSSGALAGIVTFFTLGFGDLYWAFTGLGDPAVNRSDWYVALAATAMAFLSWGTRPITTRHLLRLASEAYRTAATSEAPAATGGYVPSSRSGASAEHQRPGGAS